MSLSMSIVVPVPVPVPTLAPARPIASTAEAPSLRLRGLKKWCTRLFCTWLYSVTPPESEILQYSGCRSRIVKYARGVVECFAFLPSGASRLALSVRLFLTFVSLTSINFCSFLLLLPSGRHSAYSFFELLVLATASSGRATCWLCRRGLGDV